ncbi:hypothetical protein ACS3UN_06670 [Oscillospiraceae bacterium LTW-04]|nr:hypothetical protein RBH76_03690 [Oscillospiraceae bacterium MB24-C1]
MAFNDFVLVDGGNDGGVDGLYIFVKGNYLSDKSDYHDSKKYDSQKEALIECSFRGSFDVFNT